MTYQDFSERFEYDPDEDLLGEGGFGKIYKAWDGVRNEFVAVKTSKVLPEYEQFSLLQEYELVKSLEHPNLARYIDCERMKFPNMGTHDVALMKYYEYGNLSQLLSNHTLSDSQKQTLIDGVLAGLGYLHTQQPIIIHRDLKPSNILIVKRGEKYIPLITDFGISRKAKMNDNSFVTNTVGVGTYMYAAPEQWAAKELRPNADLWSFGILCTYIWLNGKKLPFRSEDINIHTETGRIEYMKRMLSLDFVEEFSKIPEPYQAIIRKCLVVDPQQRAKSVKEIKALVEESKESKSAAVVILPDPDNESERTEILPKKVDKKVDEIEPQPPSLPIPPKRRSAALFIIPILSIIAIVGIIGYFMYDKQGSSIKQVKIDSLTTNATPADSLNKVDSTNISVNEGEEENIISKKNELLLTKKGNEWYLKTKNQPEKPVQLMRWKEDGAVIYRFDDKKYNLYLPSLDKIFYNLDGIPQKGKSTEIFVQEGSQKYIINSETGAKTPLMAGTDEKSEVAATAKEEGAIVSKRYGFSFINRENKWYKRFRNQTEQALTQLENWKDYGAIIYTFDKEKYYIYLKATDELIESDGLPEKSSHSEIIVQQEDKSYAVNAKTGKKVEQ